MPLKIIKGDITQIECDAIVNPTDKHFSGSGGADRDIQIAAGHELISLCRSLDTISVGEAVLTPAFKLPCKAVIHTVGPLWKGGRENERERLTECYRACLNLAIEQGFESVAFPLISSGTYGFPKTQVLKIATEAIYPILKEHELLVYIVLFSKDDFEIAPSLYRDIDRYIIECRDYGSVIYRKMSREQEDDLSVLKSTKRITRDSEPEENPFEGLLKPTKELEREIKRSDSAFKTTFIGLSKDDKVESPTKSDRVKSDRIMRQRVVRRPSSESKELEQPQKTLEEMIRGMDKGFADTLFYFIDKIGITDVDCYKMSNVDKKTFSKIKCNRDYRPSKVTAVSFAVGLHLNIEDTRRLLNTAGFSLSNSNVFDVIIEYFVTNGCYKNIHEVNQVLYQFDQVTLGV